jgi:hypothetical protein
VRRETDARLRRHIASILSSAAAQLVFCKEGGRRQARLRRNLFAEIDLQD